MINENKNLIEYIGISDYLPLDLKIFKKGSSKLYISIPKTRASIKHLTKVSLDISILETKLINTPVGKSLDGLILTGKKLLCYGLINYKLHYISNEKEQNIQLYSYKVPIVESVIIPKSVKQNSTLATSIFVDDITCTLANENEIFSYVSFIISCD